MIRSTLNASLKTILTPNGVMLTVTLVLDELLSGGGVGNSLTVVGTAEVSWIVGFVEVGIFEWVTNVGMGVSSDVGALVGAVVDELFSGCGDETPVALFGAADVCVE